MKHGKKKESTNSNKIVLIIACIVAILTVFYFAKNKSDNTQVASTNVVSESIKEESNSTEQPNETIKEEQKEEEEENTVDFSKLSESEKIGPEGLPVLMYHFFYDASKGETGKDGNWLEVSRFEDHLKYLTENDFYFPTWEQVADYVEGKSTLPKKSVVLTVDDGEDSFFNVALPVVEKYDVKVTEFLVTSWNGWYKDDYPAKQMVYQSHSDDMHKAGANGKGAMVNWSYDEVLADCKKSRQILGDQAITFCYPFGHYNDTAKKALKEAGYKLAFTTEYGRVKTGEDPYALPRIRTSSSTTLEVLKELVN